MVLLKVGTVDHHLGQILPKRPCQKLGNDPAVMIRDKGRSFIQICILQICRSNRKNLDLGCFFRFSFTAILPTCTKPVFYPG
jgi:hypothetical protein